MTEASAYLPSGDLVGLVEGRVRGAPGAPALVADGQVVSFGRLGRDSDVLAGVLASAVAGVGAGGRPVAVPLVLGRGPELWVAMLAVWKVGLAYCVIDPGEPAARMRVLVRDLGAPVVVTRSDVSVDLPGGPPRVWVDRVCSGEPPAGSVVPVGDSRLAYLLYTSGSAGAPKGVLVTREALANYCAWQRRYLEITPDDRVSQLAAPSFDGSNLETWPFLTAGASVHLVPDSLRVDTAGLVRWWSAQRITCAFVPTPVAEQVLAEPGVAGAPLRVVMTGGDILRRRPPRGARFTLLNMYGPTETTIAATVMPVSPGEAGGPVPVGYPIDNTRVQVRDVATGRQVPPGVSGEVCIGGAGLAWGYHGDPARTAAVFRPDPAGGGRRVYHTGDLGVQQPDGGLTILGRIDRQTKIRGTRVEPAEIEATLARHPAVRTAAVVVVGEPDRRLVGHVACHPDTPATEAELLAHLARWLPASHLPDRVLVHPELPLTGHGKIDRRRLTGYRPAEPESVPARGPRTEAERRVVAAVAEVLGRRHVDLDLPFTRLGGHSLLAARVVTELRERLAVDIPVASLLDSESLAAFAADLEPVVPARGRPAPPAGPGPFPAAPPLVPRDRPEVPVPLSFQQEEVWFLNELAGGGNRAYHAQCTIHFTGELRVDLLERALNAVIARHDMFRSTFVATLEGVRQVVAPRYRYHLPVVDLGDLAPGERAEALDQVVSEELAGPFDLGRLPLVRWKLARMGPQEHVLVQVEHHFVHDGWSLGLLLGEIETCYTAWVRGEEPQLPSMLVQYADYVAWQRDRFAGEYRQRSLAHWVDRLRDLPQPLDLPSAKPRPATQTFRGDARRVELDRDLYRALRQCSQDEGVSLFVTMGTAFAVLLHRYTGATDVVIGSALANRQPAATAQLIGMLVNTVVLRLRVRPESTFRELLRHAREVVLDGVAHQDTPFPEVVRAVGPPRDASRNPIVQVCFSFHDSPMPELAWPGVTGQIFERSNQTAKFDLNLIVVPRAEQRASARPASDTDPLVVIWEYNTDVLDDATVDRMIGHYETLLRAGAAAPETPVGDLPLLTASEQQALQRSNATTRPIDPDLVGLVEGWVRGTAGEPAVVADGQVVSFGRLGRDSDVLAGVLASAVAGAGAGGWPVAVPLVLGRCPELLVAMLAVWKVGLAYCVIDPGEPAERLGGLLRDLGAPVVVTRSDVQVDVPGGPPPLVWVDQVCGGGSPAGSVVPVGDSRLAYLLYTSGSTGAPKGVLVTWEAFANYCAWQRRYLEITPDDRVSQLAAPSFDGSNVELWPFLTAGASVHLVPDSLRVDPAGLVRWWSAQRITCAFVPTPVAEQVLAEPGVAGAPLRVLMTGGDILRYRPPHRARFTLLNMYGPTEATIASAFLPVPPGEAGGPVPVGYPIDNTRVEVRDVATGGLVPPGVTGEVCIGGAGLAWGYHGDPARTAAVFRPDPAGGGRRVYHTGDLGLQRPDGGLTILGRIDRQTKIRGTRVEPAEIEAILVATDGVAGGAVRLWRPDELGREVLVGYAVPEAGARLDPARIRHELARRLPEYMVPTEVVVLDALPLTSRGKVDYAGLPAPPSRSEAATGPAAQTAEVQLLCRMWAEMFGVAQVGPDDDFYALGGHSLLAMQISGKLRHEHGLLLRVSDILRTPTIAGLARLLATDRRES